MEVKEFDYELPMECIAQTPLEKRSNSKLMILDRKTGDITHKHFYEIIDYLHEGDVLVLNDTKVTADEVALPEVSIKPYVKYGVGVQKKWADKFTAFGQCYVTNGGRNGVGLQAGLRIALGDEASKQKTSLLNPKKKDTKIAINGRTK